MDPGHWLSFRSSDQRILLKSALYERQLPSFPTSSLNSQHYIKHYYTSCIVMPHYEDLCYTTLNTTLGIHNTSCVVMTHYEKTTITIHFTESSHIVKSPLLECSTLLYILLGTHDMSCSHLYTQHCTHSTVHCTLDNQNYTHAKMFCSPFPQGMN